LRKSKSDTLEKDIISEINESKTHKSRKVLLRQITNKQLLTKTSLYIKPVSISCILKKVKSP